MSSELENVKNHVQQAASTINDAATATQTAHSNADDKKERLNAMGVYASYQGLEQACEKLQQAMATLGTAHGEATKSSIELQGVETTMPIPEALPKLGSAIAELGTSRTNLDAAAELVANAKTYAEQVGVEGIIAVCQGAIDMIDVARSNIDTASNAVSEYQTRLEQVATELAGLNSGGDTDGSSSATPRIASSSTTPGTPKSKLPSFNAQEYLDALPAMKPKSQRKRGQKTRGTWVVDGEDDQELASGDGSDANKAAAHWAKIRHPDEPSGLTIYGDVEPKFAMQMRDEGVTQARIVINNPDGPCGYDKGWQYGCDALLPRFLAPGSQLTVVWPGPTEKTYTGQHEGNQA